MRIDGFIWPEERIEHIARHGVTPEEVENPVTARDMTAKEKRRFRKWKDR